MTNAKTLKQRPRRVTPLVSGESAQWGDTYHRNQVRYSIRKHTYTYGQYAGKTLYYVYDEETKSVPVWAPDFLLYRTYAVGRLHKFIRGLWSSNPQRWYEMVEKAEKSKYTFTKRKKAELRHPK